MKRTAACALFISVSTVIYAQDQPAQAPSQEPPPVIETDSAIAARQALKFGDSLVKAHFYTEWNTYMALTCPSAIKYYGGKDGFKDHVVTLYYRNEPRQEEKPETLRMVSLLNNVDTWQCVIEKIRETFTEGRGKTKIYTYLVGESTNSGETWKFLDVSQNSMENVINLMPTIFGSLAIPQGKTVYVDELAAQEAAPKPVEKKKPAVKKQSR
jgi:hypothetical protein